MIAQLPVNSRCDSCKQPMLWGRLQSGKSLPLDRCPVGEGEVRLLRSELGLLIEFLSLEERYELYAQQREAEARGEQPELLYRPHSDECREKAKQLRQQQLRRRRQGRRRARR